MNKKLKFIIAGVAIVAGLASAVSCQDLSKDLADVKAKVSSLESTVQTLQNKIDAGATITDVTPTNSGIIIILSNGNKYEINNGTNGKDGKDGKDGTPGSVITIGENGNWYVDGVDTGKAAVGQNGNDGAPGKDGDSIYWALSEDGKSLVEYKNGVATGKTAPIPAAQGAITAKWDAEKGVLTIYGVEGSEEGLPIVLTNNASAAAAVSLVEAYSEYAIFDLNTLTYDYSQGYYLGYWGSYVYNRFSNVIEKDNVFEEGIKNPMTFTKGKQSPVGSMFFIRVSPANYVPKPEDFQFVNSLGITYDHIKVVSVEPYTGLLTKGQTATGLWTVGIVLDEYDEEEFESYTHLDINDDGYWDLYIGYAVKVGDAVSTYDLEFDYTDFVPSSELGFYVGKTLESAQDVEDLNNRPYGVFTISTKAFDDYGQYKEMEWLSNTSAHPTPAVAPITSGSKKNVDDDGSADQRGSEALYKAVLGEPINVYAGEWGYTSFEYDENIKGMYITFDYEANAVESAPSEWNAWKSYEDQIEGLNEVQEGPVATITINDPKADGDVIGFRVYAVNLDGTLLDPDGRAFYIQLGKPATELATINTVMNTIAQFQEKKSAVASTSFTAVNAAAWVFEMDEELADGSAAAGVFHLMDKDGADIIAADAPYDLGTATIDLSKVKKAQFEPAGDLYLWEDNKTYEGEFTFIDDLGFVVATVPVTFTKTLPTSIDQVPVKTSQLGADGKYRCFLIPTYWTAYDDVEAAEADGQEGNMDMLSIFNFPKDDPTGYEVTFANAVKAVEGGKTVLKDVTVKPDTKLADDDLNDPTANPNNWLNIVDLDLIDNTTEHTTTVVYNMGPVSSAKIVWNLDGSIKSVGDYTLNAGSFPTIFFCIYNNDANLGWNWSWKMTKEQYEGLFDKTQWNDKNIVPALPYEDFDGQTIDPSYIDGKSLWDGLYKGTMPTGYANTVKVQKVEFITKGGANDGKVEYYNVDNDFKFAKKSGATNPTAPVPSALVVSYTDMYGHEMTAEMPAKVMPRK